MILEQNSAGGVSRTSTASFLAVFILALLLGAARSQGITFTTNTTIIEGDITYNGQDVIVDGATVTINGAHSFNSVLLTNNAVLAHPPPLKCKLH
jgi:hypothetical protein